MHFVTVASQTRRKRAAGTIFERMAEAPPRVYVAVITKTVVVLFEGDASSISRAADQRRRARARARRRVTQTLHDPLPLSALRERERGAYLRQICVWNTPLGDPLTRPLIRFTPLRGNARRRFVSDREGARNTPRALAFIIINYAIAIYDKSDTIEDYARGIIDAYCNRHAEGIAYRRCVYIAIRFGRARARSDVVRRSIKAHRSRIPANAPSPRTFHPFVPAYRSRPRAG